MYVILNYSLTLDLAVILKIWGGQNDKFRLIIKWEVHLPSLQYLGDQVNNLPKTHLSVNENEILILYIFKNNRERQIM